MRGSYFGVGVEQIVANLSGKVRRETRGGREFLVAPAVMLREGVWSGSRGPLYYPRDQIEASASAWNGVPIIVRHPPDGQASARTPDYFHTLAVGNVFGARMDGERLRAECWFDAEATRRIDGAVYAALSSGRRLRVSTGLTLDAVPAGSGSVWNGRAYGHSTRNYRPDHLAVLPDGEAAACDLADGCGVNNAAGHRPMRKLILALGRLLRLVKEEKADEAPAETAPETKTEPAAEVHAVNKAQTVEWIVANCDCWKDGRADLEAMPEGALRRVKEGIEKRAEAVANAAKPKPAETPAPAGGIGKAEFDALVANMAAQTAALQAVSADVQAIKAQGEAQKAEAKQSMIDALVANVADEQARQQKAALLQSATPELLALMLAERGVQHVPQPRPLYLGAAGAVANAGKARDDSQNLLATTDDATDFEEFASPALRRRNKATA
jgi:hypothetical protein